MEKATKFVFIIFLKNRGKSSKSTLKVEILIKNFENSKFFDCFIQIRPTFMMFYDLLITQMTIFMTDIKVIMDKSSFKNLIFQNFETQLLIDAITL